MPLTPKQVEDLEPARERTRQDIAAEHQRRRAAVISRVCARLDSSLAAGFPRLTIGGHQGDEFEVMPEVLKLYDKAGWDFTVVYSNVVGYDYTFSPKTNTEGQSAK